MTKAPRPDATGEPLLPAIDAAGQLRETAFALLLRDRQPIDTADLATATGRPADSVRDSLIALGRSGWLDLDETGRVAGAAGLSLVTGPHRLTIGGAQFRTWCAYDALGISAALEEDSRVETTCGVCGTLISVPFSGGLAERDGPEQLWLADGGGDLRGSFCTPTVLLCSPAHASAWAQAQGQRGRLLDLTEAARLGGAEWAGCAAAVRQLA